MTAAPSRPALDRGVPLAPTLDGFTLSIHDTAEVSTVEGWRTVGELAVDPDVLDAVLDRAAEAAGGAALAVPASWIVEKATWYLATAALAQQLVTGAHAPIDAMRLHHGSAGWAEAVATPASGWAASDGAALASQLEHVLEPLVDAFGSLRARRALWFGVGDRVVQAALWTGAALGQQREAVVIAEAALAARTRLRAPARFEWTGDVPARRRVGCCLSYRCDDGGRCADCPVRPPA